MRLLDFLLGKQKHHAAPKFKNKRNHPTPCIPYKIKKFF